MTVWQEIIEQEITKQETIVHWIIQSKIYCKAKKYSGGFSVYDIVDYAYDLVYKIPDAIDTVAVGFDGYESCCDKYDYAMAAFAGLISGLIDAFLLICHVILD